MYENFYNLKKKPFHLNPDPQFFFGSSGHKKVLAYLSYGVRQGEGFIVVTGDVGTGKTTLIYTLLEELAKQKDIIVAHIVTTPKDAGELLGMIASAFGLIHEGISKSVLLRQLEKFLINQSREGKRTLLIVDEAQNLSMEGLEVLRMLTNFQVNHKPLLQGFLVGQAEFRNMLRSERLEQLRQRIITSCHLGPLEPDETRQYIEHRLGIAGWRGDPSFIADTYIAIHEYSNGIPRRINKLCDRILLVGYLEEAHTITQALVNSVIEELDDESFSSHHQDQGSTSTMSPTLQVATHEKPFERADVHSSSFEQRLSQLEERLRSVEKITDAIKVIMTESIR